jgi:hypothetical protein
MSYPDLVLDNRAEFARQVTAGAHRRADGGHDATPLMLPLLSFHSPVWGHEVVGTRGSVPHLDDELTLWKRSVTARREVTRRGYTAGVCRWLVCEHGIEGRTRT